VTQPGKELNCHDVVIDSFIAHFSSKESECTWNLP